MNETLREATRLLNDYRPQEALAKLSELSKQSKSSEQVRELKKNCKKLLKEQYLYQLKEADRENDYKEIELLLNGYKLHHGSDKNFKFYNDKLLLYQKKNEEEKRKQEEIDRNFIRAIILFFVVIGIFVFLAIIASR